MADPNTIVERAAAYLRDECGWLSIHHDDDPKGVGNWDMVDPQRASMVPMHDDQVVELAIAWGFDPKEDVEGC
jgi:hypothetical protein